MSEGGLERHCSVLGSVVLGNTIDMLKGTTSIKVCEVLEINVLPNYEGTVVLGHYWARLCVVKGTCGLLGLYGLLVFCGMAGDTSGFRMPGFPARDQQLSPDYLGKTHLRGKKLMDGLENQTLIFFSAQHDDDGLFFPIPIVYSQHFSTIL
jgi:hypothetical protein